VPSNLQKIYGPFLATVQKGQSNSGNVVETTRISSPELIDSAVQWR